MTGAAPAAAAAPALFHLGFRVPEDVQFLCARFHAVKYVLLAGSAARAELLANALRADSEPEAHPRPHLGLNGSKCRNGDALAATPVENMCNTGRYALFQPLNAVITVSHGIGKGSADTLLHEVTSMLRLSGAAGFQYIRLGSCGGVGVDAGSVIVSDRVVNGEGTSTMHSVVLGTRREHAARLCPKLSNALMRVAKDMYGRDAVRGTTMTCNTFYEEQARMDGAFCSYSLEEQRAFLMRCRDELGVRNFEMEALCLAAFCTRADIPCAVVCAALVDRMEEGGVDSPTAPRETLQEWEERPVRVAVRFVLEALGERGV